MVRMFEVSGLCPRCWGTARKNSAMHENPSNHKTGRLNDAFPGRWLTHRAAVLLVVACALALYSNTYGNGFHYDDREVIVQNQLIRRISPVEAFTSPSFDHAGRFPVFRPLLLLSYAANYRLGGLHPFGYHLANVLLHALVAVLLYVVTSRLVAGGSGSDRLSPVLPWLAAMFFAAHPINTETVNYIWARSTSLATVFYLLGVVCFLQARASLEPGEPRNRALRRLWIGCALAAFFLALCSKEIAITLPAVLLLTELCNRGRSSVRERAWLHVPFWVMGGAYALFMYHHVAGVLTEPPPRSVAVNLLTQFNVIAGYVRLLLVPAGLNVFHVVPEVRSLAAFPTPFSLLLLSLLVVLAGIAYRRYALITLAILWFLMTLSPTSSVLPLKVLMNEHRLYLPGMGFCILVAALLAGPVRRRYPRAAIAVALAILSLYAVGTVRRNTVWKNEVTLWADALRKSPGRVEPHIQMGVGYAERGMAEAAVAEYEKALEIYPYLPDVHYNLGNVYLDAGMYERAADEYQKMLALVPSSARGHYALGIAYGARLEFALALDHFARAKRLDPAYPGVERKIELMHTLRDLHARAMEALAQDDGDASGNFLLGNVHARLERFDDAVRYYKRSLVAEPSQYAVELALAKIYLNELGDQERAIVHIRKAAALSPDADQRARLLSIVNALSEDR